MALQQVKPILVARDQHPQSPKAKSSATNGCRILSNCQGRAFDPNNEANIKNVRGTECAKLEWHPLLPLLAIGWKDGMPHAHRPNALCSPAADNKTLRL